MTTVEPVVPRRQGFASHEQSDAAPVSIFYEEFGDSQNPTVLLIMGLSAQMLLWPTEFCERLALRGFHVIRFDNRDVGLSSKIEGYVPSSPFPVRAVRYFLGLTSHVPYRLHDMAEDSVSILDHVGVEQCHVVGASMGGMIAQILVAQHASRVRTLGLFFTCANERFVVPSTHRMLGALYDTPKSSSKEDEVELFVRGYQRMGGREYPAELDWLRTEFGVMWDRDSDQKGSARQFDAVLGTGSLARQSASIRQPTVIIHGDDDPLVRVACGKSLARIIPGAKLNVVEGMGHTLPFDLWDYFIDELTSNFVRAD